MQITCPPKNHETQYTGLPHFLVNMRDRMVPFYPQNYPTKQNNFKHLQDPDNVNGGS